MKKLSRLFSVQTLLWLSLLLALSGSLRHVAHTFTSIDDNTTWGWVQALAVDVGLFALALGITQRRRAGRRAIMLWGGVTLFSGISIYANLAYGLVHVATLPTWVTVSKPYVLAATLPILVLYLAEVVGIDVNYLLDEAEKERKRQERQAQRESQPDATTEDMRRFPMPTEQARAARQRHAVEARRSLLAFYADNPVATHEEAGAAVARSRQWVGRQLAEWERNGVISRNGDGVQVLESI